jgi:flagellar M-ring protein FliF
MSRLLHHATVVHTQPEMAAAGVGGAAGGPAGAYVGAEGEAMAELGVDDGSLHLPGPRSYEKTLDAARNMIADDPKRVAQVVRKWISEDGKH